jgi:hypothetical protein
MEVGVTSVLFWWSGGMEEKEESQERTGQEVMRT